MYKHDKHHMQSNSDMIWPISSCAFDLHLRGAAWTPSSLACHHDLHHRVFMKLSRQLLLLLLWLTVSNKVKQLHDVPVDTQVINKLRQFLWLLPVVILIDMQVMIPITRTWSISYITHISFITSFWPYHITRHMSQEQVRRPLIVVASFYVAVIGF